MNPFAQYLGQISYALYVVHGFVLRSLLYSIMPGIWAICDPGGGRTLFPFLVGITVASVIVVPATFWVADLFWRGVDKPSVRVARWVEGRVRRE